MRSAFLSYTHTHTGAVRKLCVCMRIKSLPKSLWHHLLKAIFNAASKTPLKPTSRTEPCTEHGRRLAPPRTAQHRLNAMAEASNGLACIRRKSFFNERSLLRYPSNGISRRSLLAVPMAGDEGSTEYTNVIYNSIKKYLKIFLSYCSCIKCRVQIYPLLRWCLAYHALGPRQIFTGS